MNLQFSQAFALYRLPNAASFHLLMQRDGRASVWQMDDNETRAGFVFHPFVATAECPPFFIESQLHLTDPVLHLPDGLPAPPLTDGILPLSQADYLALADRFIQATRTSAFQKIILSRILVWRETAPAPNVLSLFDALKTAYPTAFVYCVNLPHVGCWLGASPEVLLRHAEGRAETVALAGTMPVARAPAWGAKEREEQAIVRRYLEDVLAQEGIGAVESSGVETAHAGGVAHLKTVFRFATATVGGALLKALHPTPAVCGLPKAAAQAFIGANEPHRRAYYCGFLGTMNLHAATELFVNLRCLQTLADGYALYVGGGITAQSDPHAEWRETVLKSETLLKVLRHYRAPLLAAQHT